MCLCHVYFMLCSIFFRCFIFYLSFIFSFILHPSCIIIFIHILFFSLLPLDSFVYSWQKGREYTGVYTWVFHHFYMTYVHILKGKNSISCTFVGRESYKGDAYTKEEKTFFFLMRKSCFALFYFMLVFSLLYGALSYL